MTESIIFYEILNTLWVLPGFVLLLMPIMYLFGSVLLVVLDCLYAVHSTLKWNTVEEMLRISKAKELPRKGLVFSKVAYSAKYHYHRLI